MTHDAWILSCLSVVILGASDAEISKFPSSLEEVSNPTGVRCELGKEAKHPHPTPRRVSSQCLKEKECVANVVIMTDLELH